MQHSDRALVWYESPSGTGHASAALQMCLELLAAGWDVTLVSGAQERLGSRFAEARESGRLTEIPLPDSWVDYRYHPPRLMLAGENEEAWRYAYATLLMQALDHGPFDVVFTEMFPAERGPYGFALRPFLHHTKSQGSRIYAVVRDVLLNDGGGLPHDPHATTLLNEMYDAVYVTGQELRDSKGEICCDLITTWPDAAQLTIPIHYAGYFLNDVPTPRAPEEIPLHERTDVLAYLNGSWTPEVSRQCLALITAAPFDAQKVMRLVLPQPMNIEEADALLQLQQMAAQAPYRNVVVEVSRPIGEFRQLLSECRLAVIPGGLNVTLEAIACSRQILVTAQPIPGAEHGGERYFRASQFHAAGLLTLAEHGLMEDPARLAHALYDEPRYPSTPLQPLVLSGARHMMETVTGWRGADPMLDSAGKRL